MSTNSIPIYTTGQNVFLLSAWIETFKTNERKNSRYYQTTIYATDEVNPAPKGSTMNDASVVLLRGPIPSDNKQKAVSYN